MQDREIGERTKIIHRLMPMENPTPNRMIAMTVVNSATDRRRREMIQERESMEAIVILSMYYYFDIG